MHAYTGVCASVCWCTCVSVLYSQVPDMRSLLKVGLRLIVRMGQSDFQQKMEELPKKVPKIVENVVFEIYGIFLA